MYTKKKQMMQQHMKIRHPYNIIQCHSLSSLKLTLLSILRHIHYEWHDRHHNHYMNLDAKKKPHKHLAPAYTCRTTSCHNKLAVQLAIDFYYKCAQRTFYQRHLVWSQSFWGWHFPTMAFSFSVTSSNPPPPRPDPDLTNGAQIISITALDRGCCSQILSGAET